MKINERFLDEIHEHNLSYDDHLFLICRSGQRSLHAANFLIQHGFNNCTNVEDGFEGIVTNIINAPLSMVGSLVNYRGIKHESRK